MPWCTSVPFTIYCLQIHAVSSNESGEIAKILLRLQWLSGLSCCWKLLRIGSPTLSTKISGKNNPPSWLVPHNLPHQVNQLIANFLESNHFWLYDLNHVLFLESNMFNLLFKLFDSTIFVWSKRIRMPCWNQWSLCYEHPLVESWTLPAKIAPSTQLRNRINHAAGNMWVPTNLFHIFVLKKKENIWYLWFAIVGASL